MSLGHDGREKWERPRRRSSDRPDGWHDRNEREWNRHRTMSYAGWSTKPYSAPATLLALRVGGLLTVRLGEDFVDGLGPCEGVGAAGGGHPHRRGACGGGRGAA